MFVQKRIEKINLQRIFSDQPGLHGENLLFDANPWCSVCFRDAVNTVVSNHLDQKIGPRRSLESHGPKITDLELSLLCSGETMVTTQNRRKEGGVQKHATG